MCGRRFTTYEMELDDDIDVRVQITGAGVKISPFRAVKRELVIIEEGTP